VRSCNSRKDQWSQGRNWVPSHSPIGDGRCRAPLTCRCPTLQHHQDSLPPLAAPRCRLTRQHRSRTTSSTSRRRLDATTCSALLGTAGHVHRHVAQLACSRCSLIGRSPEGRYVWLITVPCALYNQSFIAVCYYDLDSQGGYEILYPVRFQDRHVF
jgi:hypothetical protein